MTANDERNCVGWILSKITTKTTLVEFCSSIHSFLLRSTARCAAAMYAYKDHDVVSSWSTVHVPFLPPSSTDTSCNLTVSPDGQRARVATSRVVASDEEGSYLFKGHPRALRKFKANRGENVNGTVSRNLFVGEVAAWSNVAAFP